MNAKTKQEKEIEAKVEESIKNNTPLDSYYVKLLKEWIENQEHHMSRMVFDERELGWG